MSLPRLARGQVLSFIKYGQLDVARDAINELADYLQRPIQEINAAYERLMSGKDAAALEPDFGMLLPLLAPLRLPHVMERLQITLALASGSPALSYLDIGSGIGRDCIAFARMGAAVTHTDLLPSESAEFAAWRYERRGLPVRIRDARRLPAERFAVIGCHDVFEHVQDPVRLMTDCVSHLAPGGLLFVSIDLFNHNETNAHEHLPKNDMYATIYHPLLLHMGMELAAGNPNPVHDVAFSSMRVYKRLRPCVEPFEKEQEAICEQAYRFAEVQLKSLLDLVSEEYGHIRRLTHTVAA